MRANSVPMLKPVNCVRIRIWSLLGGWRITFAKLKVWFSSQIRARASIVMLDVFVIKNRR
jgi:hypothetical protein